MAADDYALRLVEAVHKSYDVRRQPEAAVQMSAYVRDKFEFYGLARSERIGIDNALRAAVGPPPTERDLYRGALELWKSPERECQYVAVDTIVANRKMTTPASMPQIETLITTKSWWDTVDSIAAKIVGDVVSRHSELVGIMDVWIDNDNIWLARTAILHQLKWKNRTDGDRLFDYCLRRTSDTEFFIRKAIGWALREYSKTDADAVERFVADHPAELSGLSKREALKWLERHR